MWSIQVLGYSMKRLQFMAGATDCGEPIGGKKPDAVRSQFILHGYGKPDLTLSSILECSDMIIVQCSFNLLGSRDPPASATQVARTTGVHHHAWRDGGLTMLPTLVLNSWPQVPLPEILSSDSNFSESHVSTKNSDVKRAAKSLLRIHQLTLPGAIANPKICILEAISIRGGPQGMTFKYTWGTYYVPKNVLGVKEIARYRTERIFALKEPLTVPDVCPGSHKPTCEMSGYPAGAMLERACEETPQRVMSKDPLLFQHPDVWYQMEGKPYFPSVGNVVHSNKVNKGAFPKVWAELRESDKEVGAKKARQPFPLLS
ncbi:Protein PPP5D1 [Plecturocebus cupreus]